MAQTGEMIENPVTHDRVVFRVTAQDTQGTLLEFDDFLLAGYVSPPEHMHPRQQEHFEVIAGTLGVRIAGRDQVLRAGDERGCAAWYATHDLECGGRRDAATRCLSTGAANRGLFCDHVRPRPRWENRPPGQAQPDAIRGWGNSVRDVRDQPTYRCAKGPVRCPGSAGASSRLPAAVWSVKGCPVTTVRWHLETPRRHPEGDTP